MRFLSVPLRDLARRPVRTLLTAMAVAVAVGGAITLIGLSRGVRRGWLHQLRNRETHLVAMRKGTVEVLSSSLPEGLAAELCRVPGVEAASGELGHLVTLESGDVALLLGWPADSCLWGTLKLPAGELPDPTHPDGVVIGRQVAAALGRGRGGSLKLIGTPFRIRGVAPSSGVVQANSVFMLLPTAQELLLREGRVTCFHLRVARPDDPRALAELRQRLERAFPTVSFHESDKLDENNQMVGFLDAFTWGTSAVALAVGLLVLTNTLLMSAVERTREMGILRAVGWSGGRILLMILAEGLVLAAVGSALGIALGLGGFECLKQAPVMRAFVEPAADARLLLEVVAAALVLGTLGGLYPAWRATRVDPVQALRYE